MKLNNFGFGFLLSTSIFIIILSFKYAESFRGYTAIGGELFLLFVPVLILGWKIWSDEKNKQQKGKETK